jgi:GT2 family glycosyltransferase
MVVLMKKRNEIGILGPKLLNTDKSLQRSVRSFPTFCSMALMMLKLHNILTLLPCLRRYQLLDFNYKQKQKVDQVMGAAFMIRRKVLQTIGLLDERYFIWFEEVDYCRMAKNAGFEVWYTPEIEIIHCGGESFSQTFGPLKQRYLNDALLKYMRKHHGLIAWLSLVILRPVSMTLTWLIEFAGLKHKRK